MSWQDELRKLDEELAAGRISADDYRIRRDQTMSSAVAQTPQVPAPQTPAPESTQIMQPVSPPPPPADYPRYSTSADNQADRTQVVSGDTASGADRTQAVGHSGGWQTNRPSPQSDADRTQVVPGVPHQNVTGGQFPRPAPGMQHQQGFPPPQQQAGWGHQEEDVSPPWAGADFPPLTANTGGAEWFRQGPEVFETKRGSRGKAVAIAAVAVLVVGLGVGAYFMFRDKGGDSQTNPPVATSQTSVRPTTPTTTTPPEPIVQPEGATQVDATFTLPQLTEAKVLSPEDLLILTTNQISKARVAVTKEAELIRGAWAFTTPDTPSAERIITDIGKLYGTVGFKPAPDVTVDNVSVLFLTPTGAPGPTVYRAHYRAKDKVVRVEAYGPDPAATKLAFTTLLDDQLKQLPAEA